MLTLFTSLWLPRQNQYLGGIDATTTTIFIIINNPYPSFLLPLLPLIWRPHNCGEWRPNRDQQFSNNKPLGSSALPPSLLLLTILALLWGSFFSLPSSFTHSPFHLFGALEKLYRVHQATYLCLSWNIFCLQFLLPAPPPAPSLCLNSGPLHLPQLLCYPIPTQVPVYDPLFRFQMNILARVVQWKERQHGWRNLKLSQ